MMLKQQFLLGFVLLLVLIVQENGGQRAPAHDDELPTAQQVIDKHVRAMDGYEVLESRQSIYYSYNATFNGAKFYVKAYQVDGNYHSYLRYPSGRMIERGFVTDWKCDEHGIRGGVGWQITNGLLREMTSKELQEYIRRRGYCCPGPRLFETYKSIKCTSIETVNGFDAYKLELVDHDETELEIYIAVDTGFYVRRVVVEEFGGTTAKVTRDYLDYARLNGCLVPTKMTTSFGNSLSVYELEDFEADVKIPKGTFAIPKSLTKQRE